VKPEPSPAAATARTSSRGLGIRCEDLNTDLAAALGEPEGKGALVIQVQSGSIADRSGLRPGDIITRVGDQAVENLGRLDAAIAATPSPISIMTLRQGVTREVVAELEVASPPGRRDEAGRALDRRSDAWRDQVLLELRDEVRRLREEVQKLRKELDEPKRD
jgi:serine protease Do